MSVGDGALRGPQYWWRLRDPFTPSWGEPYMEIAERMLAAVHRARELAVGPRGAVRQPPAADLDAAPLPQGRHLWHDPRRRQCALASLTSLVFDDGFEPERAPGAVDDRVDPRQPLGERLDRVRVGDVEAGGAPADLPGQLLAALESPRRGDRLPAVRGQRPHGRLADPARGAGDQRDLALHGHAVNLVGGQLLGRELA